MTLHSDKETFREIVALAAENFGYEQSHVEKDYWVSKILKDIAMSDFKNKTYFKGGTSLFKGFGLISRFSEDLDLFVFTGDIASSKQAERTLNRNLSKYIAKVNDNIYNESLSQSGGNFRKLYFSYDNVFEGIGLKDHLEVEIKSCDLPDKSLMYYPTERRIIRPIVTEYLEGVGQEGIVRNYGLEGFETLCINPKRTMCDKISRLVKVSYSENSVELLVKHIRDVYDLCILYRIQEYEDFLNSQEFIETMYRVTVEDNLNNNSKSHLSLADAVIFRNPESVMTQTAVATAYSIDLRKLMFDKTSLPSIENAVEIMRRLHEILLRFEDYRRTVLEKSQSSL